MIKVKRIDPLELTRFYRGRVEFHFPVWGYAARRGILTTSIGGIWQGTDNRVWGFIDFKPGHRGNILYRYMRKLLAEAEEMGVPEIYTVRDHNHPTSERLLRRGGFTKTEEQLEDHEVWVWRNPRMVNDNG